MPADFHFSRRALSKTAVGAFVGAATFRPGRAVFAQDATPAASPDACPFTTPDENEAIVQRYWDEVWNAQNDAALAEVFAADEMHHWGIGDTTVGPAEFPARIATFRAAFPDFEIHVEKTVKEDDHDVSYYRATGTHQGEWLGIQPNGNTIEYNGVNILPHCLRQDRGKLGCCQSSRPGPADRRHVLGRNPNHLSETICAS